MIDFEDYFGGLTEEEYVKQSEEHFKWLRENAYESPIKIIANQMNAEYESGVLKCVQSFYPYIDKDELVKALKYDRDQYEKGYNDGAREMARRLKEWVVRSSNYWLSYSVNTEIDEVLEEMIGE